MVERLTDAGTRRWQRDKEELAEHQPGLHLAVHGLARAEIIGSVRVPRADGRVESIEITIRYPRVDPFDLPDTFDLTGRFPPEPDRHIEEDGRFCLWLPQTAPVDEFRRPGGLAFYMARVQEFVVLQLMYDVRRKHRIQPHWPGEEWAHGHAGHRQWFRETTLGLAPEQVESLVAAAKSRVNPGYRCPCRSGKRLGNCHKKWIRCLRRTVIDHSNVLNVADDYVKELRNGSSAD